MEPHALGRVAALALALAACATPHEPIDPELAASIRDALGSTREDPPRVVLLERQDDTLDADGRCLADRIELQPSGLPAYDFLLAHEVTHWYLPTSPLAGVPSWVAEGLADDFGHRRSGTLAATLAELRWRGVWTVSAGGLHASARGFLFLPAEERRALADLGLLVVRRLGLARLRQLAGRGASPLEYVRAAGLLRSAVHRAPPGP